MFDVRTVLLPFDFSDSCRAAARYGFELARGLGADVEILHTVPHSFVAYSPFDGGKYREELIPPDEDLYRWLDEEAAALTPEDWSGTWHRSVMTGDPANCIVERAEQVPGSLIVMPTHGFGKVRRFILGSVTGKVLHDVRSPLLTGRHLEAEDGFGRFPYRKVACALDLRQDSRDTLGWAWEWARRWKASLTVIHIVSWLERAPGEADRLAESLRESLLSSAVRECGDLIRAVGCEAELKVDVGSPLDLAPLAIEESGADVVVIGRGREPSHAGQLWAHAYGLIRRSPVPVISV